MFIEDTKKTILGCCWEEDDSVIEEFPNLPRCYQTERGGGSRRPNFEDLVMRSGDLMET